MVFQRWKIRLGEHGWLVNAQLERLTKARYADDILLYAKSLTELREMLELLHDELSAVGLEIHETKTKILSSSAPSGTNSLIVRGMSFEILRPEMPHRYLGRRLCACSSSRTSTEVNNRISAAWAKFNIHRRWLVNSHISLKLRMRLFEACVGPTAIFALHVLLLKVADLDRIAATERSMNRCIAGWVRHVDEDWPATMRRMRSRVARADSKHPSKSWVQCI